MTRVLFFLLIYSALEASAAPDPDPCQTPLREIGRETQIPMPILTVNLNISRRPRSPLTPLPPLPDPNSLPREALLQILMKMANFANFNTVAYGASGHRTIEQRARAQWAANDLKDDVNEYLSLLNETQKRIVMAASRAGIAQAADIQLPDEVTLT